MTSLRAYIAVVLLLGSLTAANAGTVELHGPNVHLTVNVNSYQATVFRKTVKQKYDFSCGSAAIASLLTYHYADSVTEEQVFAAMWNAGNKEKIRQEGFSLLDMKRYLEGKGYKADGFRISLDTLAKVGVPAIVLINEEGYNHFVVVKGVSADAVLIGDPAKGSKIILRKQFESMWKQSIVFLIRSQRNLAARHFNEEEEWAAVAKAPIHASINRDAVSDITLFRRGPNDF